MKALCPSWADTEIVSGVGDGMEDGAERKVAISSIVNVTIIIININNHNQYCKPHYHDHHQYPYHQRFH